MYTTMHYSVYTLYTYIHVHVHMYVLIVVVVYLLMLSDIRIIGTIVIEITF